MHQLYLGSLCNAVSANQGPKRKLPDEKTTQELHTEQKLVSLSSQNQSNFYSGSNDFTLYEKNLVSNCDWKDLALLHRIILGMNTTIYLWVSYQETWGKSLNILHYSKQLSREWKTQVLNCNAWSKNRMSCCISIFWVILFFTVYHNVKWQVKTFIDLCHKF